VIDEKPDPMFIDNVNYFVKSYLISICTYLEAYLQDMALVHAAEIADRASAAKIPRNYLLWSLNKEVKSKELSFEDVDLMPRKAEISEHLSGNPHKTITLFRYLGVDIGKEDAFSNNKDLVGSVVNKRNNIIHHNDEAMDISFSDLVYFIDVFQMYMDGIRESVCQCRIKA
jgi:hypothetical protein